MNKQPLTELYTDKEYLNNSLAVFKDQIKELEEISEANEDVLNHDVEEIRFSFKNIVETLKARYK